MSASEAPALSAVAFQLAAALESYSRNMRPLSGAGSFNPDLYRRVSQQMDEMRMYAADLPQVSVAWVELLIRHFELTHGLWRVQNQGAAAADLPQLHGQLQDAVQRLSRRCAQLMPLA